MRYFRLCRGLVDRGTLVIQSNFPKGPELDDNQDWYKSVFFYNADQQKHFEQTGSVKGITDVLTDTLVFDFDCKENPDAARKDAITTIERIRVHSVDAESIHIFYSGNKGFNVVVPLGREVSPEQAYKLADKYAGDLPTFDTSLYDAPQLIRISNTKHPTSQLFKIPLTLSELTEKTIPKIRYLAQTQRLKSSPRKNVNSESFYEIPIKKAPVAAAPKYKLDLSQKPPHWRNCKWSILQGNFRSGERSQALMVLAATCRAMKFDRLTSYYMCKSAMKKSHELYGEGEFDKKELWDKIIEQIFVEDGWNGGQYSCKDHAWLGPYCRDLGEFGCKDHEEEGPVIPLAEMEKKFVNYATNFETNVIKTGIAELDEHAMLCSSTLVGLLGQPGAGKTTLAIQYLRNTSLQNVPSMFFSLDMGLPIVYAKLAQKYTGLCFKTVMKIFRNDPEHAQKVANVISEDYKNVGFNFRAGMTIADMRKVISDHQEAIGKPVKLVVIDYLECIAGPYADATANTGFIANQLKDLANEFQACVLLLLQTQKHSTPSISDPLMTLKAVKGSSVIEQSCSTILTLWREGYDPDTIEDDRYISFAVVKNRFGSLWRGDFQWDGMRGTIETLSEEERFELQKFKKRKQQKYIEKLRQQAGIGSSSEAYKFE